MVRLQTMQLQIVSDLHIDGVVDPDWTRVIIPQAPFLLIVGDVGRLETMAHYTRFLTGVCSGFQHVYLVPGNHEFYSETTNIHVLLTQLRTLEASLANLTVLYNTGVDLPGGGYRLYGATLWSYIPEGHRVQSLPIVTGEASLANGTWLNMMHHQALYDLEREIAVAQSEGKTLIVATHYPPTLEHTLEDRHLEGSHRYYSASNLNRLLTQAQVHTWIYGHTHVNADFMSAGGTRVVSNQMKGDNYSRRRVLKW